MTAISPLHRESSREIAKRFSVVGVRVFGSVARGKAGPDSDLDLLVRFDKSATLLTLIGFQQALESQLGIKVDVVDENGLSPFIAERVLLEALPL